MRNVSTRRYIMTASDAQKSEIHESTADASPPRELEPQKPLDANTLHDRARPGHDGPAGSVRRDARTPEEAFPPGVTVRRDDSDAGGPIDIVTDEIPEVKPNPDPNVLTP